MSKFKLACECPQCGELCVRNGWCVDFTADDGVVNLMNFSQTDWYCKDCEIEFGTGDIEDIIETF